MSKAYAVNEVIFREGDKADCMFETLSGSVGIFVNYGDKNEKRLTILEAGAVFGEMGLLEKLPRSATAVALEETTVELIREDGFADYFRKNPEKVLSMMRHMSARIRGLTHDYLNACRAVSESEASGKDGKRSSWFKNNVKRFMQDYADATVYMSQHAELFTNVHRFDEYPIL